MPFNMVYHGTDPELFVFNKQDELVPAGEVMSRFLEVAERIEDGNKVKVADSWYRLSYDHVPYQNKQIPVPVLSSMVYDTKLVVDGAALEFTTKPYSCRNHVMSQVHSQITRLDYLVKAANPEWDLVITPAVLLDEEQLEALPPEARVFGCSPDKSIYSGMEECPVVDATNIPIRSAGGHIHSKFYRLGHSVLGEYFEAPNAEFQWYMANATRLVVMFDRIVGILLTAMTGGSLESIRRGIYGQAGKFRLQRSYQGIEYRTPSSSYFSHPILVNTVMLASQVANNVVLEESIYDAVSALAPIEDVVRIINNSETDRAMELANKTIQLLAKFNSLSNPIQFSNRYYHQLPEFLRIPEYFFNKGGIANVFSPQEAVTNWTQYETAGYGLLPNISQFDEYFS